MKYYVALDVHSKRSTFLVQDEHGAVIGRGEIPTTPDGLRQLKSEYQLPAATPVGLESGTVAFYVARELARLELSPVVVDAYEVRRKANRPRQKSDRRDTFELCEGLRRGIYRAIVHVPPEAISRLRETLSRRRHFVRLQTAEVNAVKRLLRSMGLAHLSRHLGSEISWTKLTAALPPDHDVAQHVAQHRAVWQCTRDQIRTLDQILSEVGAPFAPDVERLQTVVGVGPVVALTVVAAFSDVRRFPSAKHAASYAGLVPATYQSGDCNRHGRITKRGSTELRAMLCEAAHHAGRRGRPLSPYFTKLCARRGYKMAVVALAHRLCRILFAMRRDGTTFDLSKVGLEEGLFEHRVIHRYRFRTTASR